MSESGTGAGLSAIHRQIMWNRLLAVVEEQAQTLLRTAFSPIVRESGDLSAGVFDLQGHMLAQAVTGTPGHVNSMAESVRHFLAAFPVETMAEGDVYCTNNPWKGTGHLNDLVVTTPAFHRGRLVGLFSCTSHIVDLGGIGFGPDGTDVFMEGLHLPFLKLFERGRLNETLMAILKVNTRLPVETEGDVYSLVNCNEIGCRRLSEMMAEFELANLEGLAAHILESSRAAVLAEIGKLPRGKWRYDMTIDGYDAPVTLAATTTVSTDSITVDFIGTSAASRFGINSPLAYTTAYSVFGLSCAVAPRVPNNAGSLSCYGVTAPAGASRDDRGRPAAYVPFPSQPGKDLALYLAPIRDNASALRTIRAAVAAEDPDQPIESLMTMEEAFREQTMPARFVGGLMSALSLVALLLASVGLYGVTAYALRARMREIGVRIALGATSRRVVRLILASTWRLIVPGIVLGLLGAWAATRLLVGLLFGTSPTDPAVFAAVVVTLAAVATLAAYLPARRAARVDPMLVLRSE